MTFAWPHLLWLIAVPVMLLVWDLARHRRAASTDHPKILRAEIGPRALSLAGNSRGDGKNHVRPWLAMGLALAIVALARPQWGRIEEPVFDQSREILLAIDLSRSMMAPDVKPSRLERAKLLIQSLLEKLKGERVGLVVFSGTAFLQSPLSSDYEILREFLPALKPDFLPEGGTNYQALIDTSLDAFGSSTAADRFLIVLSDGEATDDDWQSRIDELKKRGIRVIGLGVGTSVGSMIPDGSGGFIKDDRGAVVLSKLESGTLQQLAEATGGTYRDASTWIDLASLIDQTVNAGKKGSFVDKNTVRFVERFQWPLAFALWCFVISFYFEFPVRPRPRAVRLKPEGGSPEENSPSPSPAQPSSSAAALSPGPKSSVSCVVPFLLGFLALGLGFGPFARAAVKVAPVQGSPSQPSSAPPPPNEPPLLSRIVGRLSNADVRTARDWAELAGETVSWGQRLRSAQHPVPEGPVRDALGAVDLGSQMDARAADWSKLRQELQELLQKQEPPKQQPKQQQQQQNQQQKDQPKQQDQNQSKSGADQSKSDQSQQQKQEQNQQQPKEQPQQPEKKEAQQSPAFGDMKKPEPPSQPASESQRVGGTDDQKARTKEQVEPALALPMEKLDQLKNQDSPAKLFELMQADQKQAPKKKNSKDW